MLSLKGTKERARAEKHKSREIPTGNRDRKEETVIRMYNGWLFATHEQKWKIAAETADDSQCWANYWATERDNNVRKMLDHTPEQHDNVYGVHYLVTVARNADHQNKMYQRRAELYYMLCRIMYQRALLDLHPVV